MSMNHYIDEDCKKNGHLYIQRENGSIKCIVCKHELPRDPL
jgi:hypothetical protein